MLKLNITGCWFISLMLAVTPFFYHNTPVFQQEAIVSNIAYSRVPEMKFSELKELSVRLLTFHPALRNASNDQEEILEASSWSVLMQFLNRWIPRDIKFSGYKG